MIEIVFDLFLKDEYNIEQKVTDHLESFTVIREIDRLYSICELVLSGFTFPKSLAQDGSLRIRAEVVNDTIPATYLFTIDDISVVDKDTLKIIGKAEPIKMFHPYASKVSTVYEGDTYNSIISQVLDAYTLPHTLLIDTIVNSLGYFTIEDEYEGDALTELLDSLGLDYYYKSGEIIIEQARGIQAGDSAVEIYTQTNMLAVQSANAASQGVGSVVFNGNESEVVSTPSMVMAFSRSPQPISPTVVKEWTDETTGDIYKINPIACNVRLFYNPLTKVPVTVGLSNVSYQSDYTVLESYTLTDESSLAVAGGIKQIMAIEYVPYDTLDKSQTALGLYDNGTPLSALFKSARLDEELSLGSNIKVVVEEAGLSQAISSTIAGTGTSVDPYIYTISLGSSPNVVATKSTAEVTVTGLIASAEYIMSLNLFAKVEGVTLNGHLIKVDATGVVATEGYSYSGLETVFYLDKNKQYEHIAEYLYEVIRTAVDLPYTAEVGEYSRVVDLMTPPNTAYTAGTFAGGVESIYVGQRDLKAVTAFVLGDPNAVNIVTCIQSLSEDNPVTPTVTFSLGGGYGLQSNIADVGGYTFDVGHNLIIFDQPLSGTLRLNYVTDIVKARYDATETEANIVVKANHYNCYLKHLHQIAGDGYYPETYYTSIDVADFLNIDYIDALYKPVTIITVDYTTGAEIVKTTTIVNSVGEIEILLTAYAQYGFRIEGQETIYLKHFANLHEITLDKIVMREVESK